MAADSQPITWTDKTGETLVLTNGKMEDRDALAEMYDAFEPKGMFQGLPPIDLEGRSAWIVQLLERAENFLAWHKGKVIGHACLILDTERTDGEFLIFISAAFRNRGLGSRLTRMAIDRAIGLELKTIWLTVEAFNFRATRVYKKCGFVFRDHGESERIMVLEVRAGV